MKQLTWKLVLPLTIISFVMFTKWWYVKIDESTETLTGFPLPFVSPGWHTSLSLQIFVLELTADIIVYFSIWFLVILTAHKFLNLIRIPKFLTITLLLTSGIFTGILTLLAINPDNIYTTTRSFDIEIMETGYRFLWQEKSRIDYAKYNKDKEDE